MELSDKQIVETVLKGDINAFSEVVERYKGLIYSICLKILRNPSKAENATQESFTKIYIALSNYKEGSFKSWICTISYRTAIDCFRKGNKNKIYENDISEMEEYLEGNQGDLLEKIVEDETSEHMRKIIELLPEKYKIIIQDFYFLGKSHKQISQERNMTLIGEGSEPSFRILSIDKSNDGFKVQTTIKACLPKRVFDEINKPSATQTTISTASPTATATASPLSTTAN